MPETTEKKAKAPAKRAAKPKTEGAKTTRKAPAKKTEAAGEKVTRVTPTHEEIARLAEKFWAERGHQDGQAEQDWLRAEQELMKKAS